MNKSNNITEVIGLTEKERIILDTFERILPELTETEKDRLLWYAEGIRFKVLQEKRT